jgi:predicted GNAT family N-acyltransferase
MTFRVENVDWENEKNRLRKLRERVFVYEWRIPKEYEFDQYDGESDHVLVLDKNDLEVATGRLTPQGEIGRIAVIPEFRGPEIYQTLFHALLHIAKMKDLKDVSVQCDLDGVQYYEKQGFKAIGAVYMDAGIPRQRMACTLDNFALPRVELTH